MTLIKTSFWTDISKLIKAISTYHIWKTIALYVGPARLAVVEQFQNFIQISRSLSCSLGQAIVKYVAEYINYDDKKSRILSSELTFYLIATFFVAMILLCFSLIISNIVFKSAEYANAIRLLGISLILFSLNNFFLPVMNDEIEMKKYVSSNIVNPIILFAFGLQG